jgi:hypothetical protein
MSTGGEYIDYAEFMRSGPHAPHYVEVRAPAGAPLALGLAHLPAGDHPDPPVPSLAVHVLVDEAGTAEVDLGAGR